MRILFLKSNNSVKIGSLKKKLLLQLLQFSIHREEWKNTRFYNYKYQGKAGRVTGRVDQDQRKPSLIQTEYSPGLDSQDH